MFKTQGVMLESTIFLSFRQDQKLIKINNLIKNPKLHKIIILTEGMKQVCLQVPQVYPLTNSKQFPKLISSYVWRARIQSLSLKNKQGLLDSPKQTSLKQLSINLDDIRSNAIVKSLRSKANKCSLPNKNSQANASINILALGNQGLSERKDRRQNIVKEQANDNSHESQENNLILQYKKSIKSPNIRRFKSEQVPQTQNLNQIVRKSFDQNKKIHRSESQDKVFISYSQMSKRYSTFQKRLGLNKYKKMKLTQIPLKIISSSFFGRDDK